MKYDYQAGLGAAVVALPTGNYLLSVSAWAAAPGASMQIGTGALIPVPINGSVTANPNRGVVGTPAPAVLNVTFVGTTSYFVEWCDSPF